MPSSTLTSAGPCDSPAVVKRSIIPPKKTASPTRRPGSRNLSVPARGYGFMALRRSRVIDISPAHIYDHDSFRGQAEELDGQGWIGSHLRRRWQHGAERTIEVRAERDPAAKPV